MPNIIINNYCNQKCSYCFANENMKNEELQKNMTIKTYLIILKYLKFNNDNNVRILGWEPLLSKNMSNFIQIATKWWFDIIIFSNINIKNNRIVEIFWGNKWNIRVNCNINNEDFYTMDEIRNIEKNLDTFNELRIKTILWYNITDISKHPNFLIRLAKKHDIKALNLKITNTEMGKIPIMDNSDRKLWIYIFDFIQKYYKDFFIEISCWLDRSIFTEQELSFIKNEACINLQFWCEGNIWKFDINTDGEIFKCFPLKWLSTPKIYITQLLKRGQKISSVIEILNNWTYNKGVCFAYKKEF